jgi:hypothetical protein
MTDKELAEFARRRIAHYKQEQETARRLIDQIDNRGFTYQERVGENPWRDVTLDRRAELARRIDMLEEIIAMLAKDLGGTVQ